MNGMHWKLESTYEIDEGHHSLIESQMSSFQRHVVYFCLYLQNYDAVTDKRCEVVIRIDKT